MFRSISSVSTVSVCRADKDFTADGDANVGFSGQIQYQGKLML